MYNDGVSSSDRLTFTVFLAIALHGLVLSMHYNLPQGSNVPPTLEITLAKHKSSLEPEQADYLAQHNQQASGTVDEKRQLTTDQVAEFADNIIRELSPQPQVKAVAPSEPQETKRVSAEAEAQFAVQRVTETEREPREKPQVGEEIEIPVSSPEIASLKEKLDRMRQTYAKRPRIRTLTSVATKSSADAAYLHAWREKIEYIGNRNYPDEARQQKLYGDLRLLVSLMPNGTIANAEILQSSGYQVLDQAALQIVHLAAPYPPFPPEIRANTDRLNIIRTWRFVKGDRLSAE